MPKYEIVDLQGHFAWIRLPNGKYIVDLNFEHEFINLFSLHSPGPRVI